MTKLSNTKDWAEKKVLLIQKKKKKNVFKIYLQTFTKEFTLGKDCRLATGKSIK